MNTKEAIEFVEEMRESVSKQDQFGGGGDSADTVIVEINTKEVIKLLKRGEKFEKMWGKVKEDYGEMKDNCPEGFKDRWLFAKTIKLYEQKYFPKGG